MAPVQTHLDALTRFLEQQVYSFEPEVQELVAYCLKNQGKRIRPMLLFYSGWSRGGRVDEHQVKAAAVVELVHLATLVHDDILDDASLRHNSDTVCARYGSSTAVLLGDALFSQALYLAAQFPTVEVCQAVSLSTRRVCAGEIHQTFDRGNNAISLEEYYRVIDLKTAELFTVSCQLGASLAGYEQAFVEAVACFGRHLGIAYQMFDDVADFYGDEIMIGKTLGTDLASGKFTLPLLRLIEQLEKDGEVGLLDRIRQRRADVQTLTWEMKQRHIFASVYTDFQHQLQQAEAALLPWEGFEPVEPLLAFTGYVRHQFQKLDPVHISNNGHKG